MIISETGDARQLIVPGAHYDGVVSATPQRIPLTTHWQINEGVGTHRIIVVELPFTPPPTIPIGAFTAHSESTLVRYMSRPSYENVWRWGETSVYVDSTTGTSRITD